MKDCIVREAVKTEITKTSTGLEHHQNPSLADNSPGQTKVTHGQITISVNQQV
jgi:hypothetical protein